MTDTRAAPPPLLLELLAARGITEPEAIERFLAPEYERDTHDPFLLSDMDVACARLVSAIESGERIAVYSDYDCDGIPGAVVLHDLFKKLGYENTTHYIPHRNREGFGLNAAAINILAEDGVSLIITVDCGIGDVAAIARAKERGIDTIITDHHLENGARPEAAAILNPNKAGDPYPDKHLCGAAVAFKFAQAFLARLRETPGVNGEVGAAADGWEKWLLDMVALATLSDMVPLVGENRVLARYGLLVLRKSRRPGLQQLCKKLRIDQRHITEDDIGFMIAPRINAASRMGEAMDAFRLLATNDVKEAGALVAHLDKINNERKGLVASMVREIRKRLAARGEPSRVIVVGDPRWKPSLLGLAANSLAQEYERPVFLWGREDGDVIKGSCRSEGRTNLSALMQEARDAFLEFGGHAYSGGFSLGHEQVHTLENVLSAAHERLAGGESDEAGDAADRELSLADITRETHRALEQLAPFGTGNPKPIFLFRGLAINGVRHFGKTNEHLELSFSRGQNGPVKAIKFFAKDDPALAELSEGAAIDLTATFDLSRFGGREELRLRIVAVS